MSYDPPLSGVRILDLSTGPMTAVSRLFADLGAEVTVARLRGVTDDATVGPYVGGVAIGTAINRDGMPAVEVDPFTPEGREAFSGLLDGADILIESSRPGSEAEAALAVRTIHAEHPDLVILSLSDFGRDTEYRTWQATSPVLHALSSELSRSGIPGREPLIPPADLPYQVAAAQAAVMTLSVFLDRLRTGEGDLIDFAVLDGAMQALDPPFGSAGSASAGVAVSAQPRNWDAEKQRYPIIACKDGHVRICILSKRQWQGMFTLMGSPEEFADPSFDKLGKRFRSPHLLEAIEAFCADKTRAELEARCQAHGVPAAAVLTLSEALNAEHFTARGFFHDAELAPGVVAPIPVGVSEIDGHRASSLNAPQTASARPSGAPMLAARQRKGQGLPLEGIRVLDLGVIVVGADTARLFGDLGADVVKIEHSAHMDGLRIGRPTAMTQPFAAGHRNKRSIGIDLRLEEGRELAHRLVAQSDVVLTNYKPGVAESLGMEYATLRRINPNIVVVDSSAFGPTGPWAKRLGYGPLVRAAVGFTNLWTYPGEPDTFCDTVTVYPDHVAARIGTLSALALLLRRERTGEGGAASISQAEVMLSHLAADIAADALQRAGHTSADAAAADTPWGLYRAAGEDCWIAITARDDADRRALAGVVGHLAEEDGSLDDAVRAWTAQRSHLDAMTELQAAGVPAGAVLHAHEIPQWGYYEQRRAFREELHPHGTEPFMMENVQIHCDHVPDPPLGQAPLLGEQTAEIAAELLGLGDDEIAALLERGVLENPSLQAPAPM
ncbi:CaiB/BaiF CoA-transferase family protein [Mycolicibacterium parafortuitum]|uniref:Predictected acyl-CoA transferase [Gordonia sp. KTR9] n=1 Tax=Mycolicibacterium parafortuitum TaxID=39692 RepID=A0A375YQ99_MYCPF|nr:CoA transferase [Mycolicibacterium parafortuitum]ORB28221.1 CoA transferase [Mycolicibacterium parafortuitum]SRX83316.1 Predictected acyl-CoA transferase [Gordonia sp. KTR9] [Mycolicibacterium parafortuitum]